MDTEEILFLQEHAATEALALYAAHGAQATIAHLSQWHQPGHHTTGPLQPVHRFEERHCLAGYVLTVNPLFETVSLQYQAVAA